MAAASARDSHHAGGTAIVLGALMFGVLATANAGGYRYGTSDQAFYIPVITHALNTVAFPRDGALIDAQGHLMVLDELLASVVRLTGLPLELIFLAGYGLSLVLIWAGIALIGARVYRSAWATAALGAAFTLRHRIPETSANSFEPYFHPRMLAFGVGLLAIAAVQRGQAWTAVALVAVAAIVHVTTGLWLAVLVGVALALLDTRMRTLAVTGLSFGTAVLLWAFGTGRLAGALTPMDSVWLQAVATKDSLFATDWPAWAWGANLGLLAVIWWAHAWRNRRGLATPADRAFAWGATALVALFFLTLPLVAARAALPVQLQISRVFWLLDFVATLYLIAAIADARTAVVRGVALLLIAVSLGRGAYVMLVEHPERALIAVYTPDSPWEDAMRWVARQPPDLHVVADPGHVWKFGTSVRVSGSHDVLLEEVKDAALAIYSRDVARRVVDRTAAIGDFRALTADRARELARRYDLDVLVTDADLPLPLVYRNDHFRIYAIAPADGQ
ncbi:MAG: hypothetical protein EXQ59_02020 [Acidobacteria bacterium]|nr:hypothetical protein [Acidobacteriota bacterium]